VALVAQLLGPPTLASDGATRPAPRGRKVWALLAYLALADRPPTRQQLADLLFPEAEDPANAFRWTLSELRRLLGGPETVGSGSTVGLRLPSGSVVDVHVLIAGTSSEAVDLPGLGRELLEGVDVEASPGFGAWLLAERRRLQTLAGSVLREAALHAIAAGNPRGGVELATRLIGADPLNEDAHVLLVRAFAATGDEVAVERQMAASKTLFRRELGTDLGPELYEAARVEHHRVPDAVGGAASVRALLETGDAALSAGAVDVAIVALRKAATDSRGADGLALEAAALLALGSALVHASKSRDEEGAAALHRAIAVAEAGGDRGISAAAHRELGYVELLRGEYARSAVWLQRATELADGDPRELAKIRSVVGAGASDVGRHGRATAELCVAVDLAASVGDGRQRAWAMTCLGRAELMCAQLEAAETTLTTACELARAERWTAFIPFPEALLAEVQVRRGRPDLAAHLLEHSFALACSVDDACWEAYSVRGLGLVKAASGDLEGSIELMEDALTRCLRQADTHRWISAYVMDALCAVGTALDHPRARAWVTDLGSLAGRSGMREFAVHAYLYERDLGSDDAIEAARTLALGVENPFLVTLIEDGPPLLEVLLGRA
jgi:DNA-binding SARP family transcriptional activator